MVVEAVKRVGETPSGDYFNDELMSVNLVLKVPPRPFTMAMMAREMPAAIRPYSIAVAPDSSDKKFRNLRFNSTSAIFVMRYPHAQRYPMRAKGA
jgi:hypothetical protein